MGNQIGSDRNLFVSFFMTVIFAIGFNDLRDIAMTFVRVVTGVGISGVADGIARYILRLSNNGRRLILGAAICIDDLKLIAKPAPGSKNSGVTG